MGDQVAANDNPGNEQSHTEEDMSERPGGALDTINDILTALPDSEKRLSSLVDRFDKVNRIFEEESRKTEKLLEQMRVLHERMDEVEQYNRSNIIEIQGVPRQPAEDVLGLVKILGRALDYEITDGMIDNCHRMGGGKSEGAAIIVKFVRKLDKEALLQRRRSRREFSARHLGFPGDGPVYLNESFCPRKRRLFALVRQMKAELGYKYLWVRGSQIYVRKHDQSPALVLKTLEDLKNL